MAAIKNAIIVGGGIGGLSVAYALQRIGVAARVIERGDRGDRLGTGITLLGNSLRALDQLGLADACMAGGWGWEKVSMRDAAGNILVENSSPRVWDADRAAALGIMRPRLGQILEDCARESGARIDFNTTVTQIDQGDDQVNVTLSSGETTSADLLIAADGVYSKTRELVFGTDQKPEYAGQGCWRYTIPRPDAIEGCVIYRLGLGKAVGALPLSKELCYLFILENSEEKLRVPDDRIADHVRALLQPFTAPELVEAREAIDADRHISYRPFDIMMMPAPWHRGRVVLLGDAAHSVTPQLTSGGGMAIEDALVLSEELEKNSDVGAALQAYAERREPRARRVYDIGLAMSIDERFPKHGQEYQTGLLMEGHRFLAAPV